MIYLIFINPLALHFSEHCILSHVVILYLYPSMCLLIWLGRKITALMHDIKKLCSVIHTTETNKLHDLKASCKGINKPPQFRRLLEDYNFVTGCTGWLFSVGKSKSEVSDIDWPFQQLFILLEIYLVLCLSTYYCKCTF